VPQNIRRRMKGKIMIQDTSLPSRCDTYSTTLFRRITSNSFPCRDMTVLVLFGITNIEWELNCHRQLWSFCILQLLFAKPPRSFRITGFLDFVHRPVFSKLKNTKFRKVRDFGFLTHRQPFYRLSFHYVLKVAIGT
jgi:hypothetical protein